jgi:hypothetical protein
LKAGTLVSTQSLLQRPELNVNVVAARWSRYYRSLHLRVGLGTALGKMGNPLPNPNMEKAEAKDHLGVKLLLRPPPFSIRGGHYSTRWQHKNN